MMETEAAIGTRKSLDHKEVNYLNFSLLLGKSVSFPPATIPDLFRAFAHDSTTALIHGNNKLTFSELDHQSDAIAAAINHLCLSVDCEDSDQMSIAILLPPSQERIIAMLALAKVHVTCVPLDCTLPPERMLSMIQVTNARWIITNSQWLFLCDELKSNVKVIDYKQLCQTYSREELTCDFKSLTDPRVCALFTSGSSGEPKCVYIRNSNLMNRLHWYWEEMPFSEGDTGCHKTSLLFVDSLTEIWSYLLRGRTLLIVDTCDVQRPEVLLKLMSFYSVTRITVVPTLLSALCLAAEMNPHITETLCLRLVICSGETLLIEDACTFFRIFKNVLLANFYGSSEVTGDVTFELFDSESDVLSKTFAGHLSIGKPIFNTAICLLDEQLSPVPVGQSGEIYVSGLNVVSERTGNDTSYPNPFHVDQPIYSLMFHTHDIGVIHNGRVIFNSRADSCIKLAGKLVNLREIENLLNSIGIIDKVTVLACRGLYNQIVPVAFYCIRDNIEDADAKSIIYKICKHNLPSYMIPALYPIDTMPLQLHTGKIDRQRLVNMYRELDKEPVVMKKDGLDTVTYKVLEVVQQVIGPGMSQDVTIDDNFFALGGDSLKCLIAVRELLQAGLQITVDDFLQATSVKEIADKVCDTNVSKISAACATAFKVELIDDTSDIDLITRFVAHSFVTMNPLDMLAGTEERSLIKLLHSIWREVVSDNLSIYVRHRETSAILSVAIVLNCATAISPDISGSRAVIAINQVVEEPVLFGLDDKSVWADYFLAAISSDASYKDRIRLLQLMQSHVLATCEHRGYNGVVTVNSHPVTAMLDELQFGYTVESKLHVRSFEFEGKWPFEKADDDYTLKAMIKRFR